MSDDLIAAHRDVPALAPSSPSAGPIRLGPDADVDEPPASRRRLSRHRRARARGAAGHRLLVRFHRRLSRRDRRRFRGTLALVRAVGFASSYAFKYSPRPGTPAAEVPGQIDEATKARRLAGLQALLEEQRQAFNRATVGRRFEVLFEKPGRREGQVDRPLALYAGGVRRGAAVADRRHGRGRNRRRRAPFAPRTRCLASVVKLGF